MIILGIETSCDETSAAVIQGDEVLSNVISSQRFHSQFGGVVPELASRAHLRKVIPIVETSLREAAKNMQDIEGFAVTNGPGLIGALLVGVNFVKGLASASGKPLVGVNHIEGHVYSNFLGEQTVEVPFLCLLVSGGHTQLVVVEDHLKYRLIGKTRDDAVGEAFDKVAKLLKLPYPGGPEIDKRSRQGDADYVRFPLALVKEKTFDFSYSGLKTAVMNFVNQLTPQEREKHLADICAAFQKAAIMVLINKTLQAARTFQLRQIAVAGGVAANSYLRQQLQAYAAASHLTVYFPEMQYCTDNAAMIARAGLERLRRGFTSRADLNAYPSLLLGEDKSY